MAVTTLEKGALDRALRRGEMAEVEAAAGVPNPRNDRLYTQLLDRVVGELAARGAEPTEALAAAGRVVRGTAWSGYRGGRARLATAAATYLTWLVPTYGWKYFDVGEIAGRRPIGWQSPDGEVIIDVLGGGKAYTRIIRQVRAVCTETAVIRVLDLLAPRRSQAYPKGSEPVALVDSPWWFEGSER